MSKNDRHAMMQARAERQMAEQVLYEVNLGDRYSVKIGEITGFDEQMVLKMLGDKFKMSGAGAMLYRNAMIGRAVKFVMNKMPRNPETGELDTSIEPSYTALQPKDAETFLNSLKGKEKSRLEAAYSEINEISDEERNEVKNAVTPTIES